MLLIHLIPLFKHMHQKLIYHYNTSGSGVHDKRVNAIF